MSSAIPFFSDRLEPPFRHAHVFRTAWFCFTVIKRRLRGKDWFVARRPNLESFGRETVPESFLVLEYRLVLQELIQNVRKNCSGRGELPIFAFFFTEGLNNVP